MSEYRKEITGQTEVTSNMNFMVSLIQLIGIAVISGLMFLIGLLHLISTR